MTRFLRNVRLVPIVLAATMCLFGLKVVGILLDGGYTLADPPARPDGLAAPGSAVVAHTRPGAPATPSRPAREQTWAGQMFNFPDVTGSLAGEKQAEKNAVGKKPDTAENGKPDAAKDKGKDGVKDKGNDENAPVGPSAGGTPISLDPNAPVSAGERAVLERLGERRQELDARARELDIRENLLKAAEKRLEARATELKLLEQRINASIQKRDEAEAARFKGLVTMYENMKPKDAARIFDRLDLKILLEVATQINPRRMSDIMAQMSSEAAEKLTIELANRASGGDKGPSASDLPKIDGRPNGS
ncbi:MAG TPA: flagellar protein FlbB [Xanthobacteraceae bacterium]|jgi:flagellar motility protein MotE (MotC chaperone)|nr:flagellar protein FlbB [Xanthobacteraceae bacterium]